MDAMFAKRNTGTRNMQQIRTHWKCFEATHAASTRDRPTDSIWIRFKLDQRKAKSKLTVYIIYVGEMFILFPVTAGYAHTRTVQQSSPETLSKLRAFTVRLFVNFSTIHTGTVNQ
jgi:hypothetical protein